MKLYLVHCGFYDLEMAGGIYESHVNFFVCADNFEDARVKAKELPDFKAKRMHVDGVQEIEAVGGYRVCLERSEDLTENETRVHSHRHRDLAPKPAATQQC